MPYGFKIAFRYFSANRTQTGLLIAGVAVGVFVFVFMSALIGGLAVFLVERTVGDIAHVTVEAPDRDPTRLLPEDSGTVLLVQQRSTTQRQQLRTAAAFLPWIEALPGVAITSQQIVGNGFLAKGQLSAPVGVTGVEPDKVSAIADIKKRLVSGTTDLNNSTVLIGKGLADDLGLQVGQVTRLRSENGPAKSMVISGIFEIGLEALDKRSAFVSLSAARTLFEMPQGISRIEIKLDDLNQADVLARRIATQTGLKATPWTASNGQLLDGLRAQATSGDLIKAFALITVVIGVASALLLSTYRRRSEIGIMRAMGASRVFVVMVFVTQGTLIGLIGGIMGAALGYAALAPFPVPEMAPPGGLPVDVRQGAYGIAILLTTVGAIVASILPARAAARVDPASVISQ